jgi:hypothetical protein
MEIPDKTILITFILKSRLSSHSDQIDVNSSQDAWTPTAKMRLADNDRPGFSRRAVSFALLVDSFHM